MENEYYINHKEQLKKKALDYYYTHKDEYKYSRREYRKRNRKSINEYQRKWLKTPEGKRSLLKWNAKSKYRKYGLSVAQVNEMRHSQNETCAICSKTFSNKKEMHIDHNHATGMVRQLLCRNCNCGIGHFGEDVSKLEKAIQYLNKWNIVSDNKVSGITLCGECHNKIHPSLNFV